MRGAIAWSEVPVILNKRINKILKRDEKIMKNVGRKCKNVSGPKRELAVGGIHTPLVRRAGGFFLDHREIAGEKEAGE